MASANCRANFNLIILPKKVAIDIAGEIQYKFVVDFNSCEPFVISNV